MIGNILHSVIFTSIWRTAKPQAVNKQSPVNLQKSMTQAFFKTDV
jgi:hypothetical protein